MEDPPPWMNLSATQVPRIQGITIATFCLAIIAVVLRFTARRLTRAAFWWDDWLMLPAIVRCDIAYTIATCSYKFSLLAFYWRIFKQSKIRVPIYVLWAIVTCWGIAGLLLIILACQPVSDYWNQYASTGSQPSHCRVNVARSLVARSIPNFITDAAILVLPMPLVWQLHLSKAQKLALTGIFALGIAIVGVAVGRFVVIINLDTVSPDITWNFVNFSILTVVESNVGIICGMNAPFSFLLLGLVDTLPACLPSLRPLLNLILFGSIKHSHDRNDDIELGGGLSSRALHVWNSHLTTSQIRRGGPIKKTADTGSDRGFARLPEEGSTEGGTHISASQNELDDMHPYPGIMVRTDVYVGEDDKE
ncbi:MAG: hypothetical protein Q9202_007337 [Teloschistes flavicans]